MRVAQRRRSHKRLRAKLAQMVIEVLVHQYGPFVRGHTPEKRVWVRRAPARPRGAEALDQRSKPSAFGGEITLIGDDDLR